MVENEEDDQINIELISSAIGGIESILLTNYIIGFQNRLSTYRILQKKFEVPDDSSIDELLEMIKEVYPYVSAYFNTLDNRTISPEIEKMFEGIFTQEYIDEMISISKQYYLPIKEDSNNLEQIELNTEIFLQSFVKFFIITIILDIKIIESMNDYADYIKDTPLLTLSKKEPYKLLNRLKRLIMGYSIDDIQK